MMLGCWEALFASGMFARVNCDLASPAQALCTERRTAPLRSGPACLSCSCRAGSPRRSCCCHGRNARHCAVTAALAEAPQALFGVGTRLPSTPICALSARARKIHDTSLRNDRERDSWVRPPQPFVDRRSPHCSERDARAVPAGGSRVVCAAAKVYGRRMRLRLMEGIGVLGVVAGGWAPPREPGRTFDSICQRSSSLPRLADSNPHAAPL